MFGLFVALLISTPELRADQTPVEAYRANIARGARDIAGTLLVETRAPGLLADHAPRLGCRVVRRFGRRPIFLLDCDKTKPNLTLIDRWSRVEGVAWVEADFVEDELDREPNDLRAEQWHHHNTGQTIDLIPGVPGADIGSLAAWEISTGTTAVVVAVLDTGLYGEHEDLVGRLWVNSDEDCTNGQDDDQNGYVDDCRGWDVGEADNDPDFRTLPADTCNEGHGTFIAGLIGAIGDNGVGIAGVAWNVTLMNIKRNHDMCNAATSMSIEGTAYAADNGARIVSIAFNGRNYSGIYDALLKDLARRGVVVVMSAGNDAEDNDTISRYPNNYDFATRLVVANTTNTDELRVASNWGRKSVDLGAPGGEVYSTGVLSPNEYKVASGTSFSQAIVAGAAALAFSARPSAFGVEIVEAIKQGTVPLPALDCGQNVRCVATGGRLSVPGMFAALDLISQPPVLEYRRAAVASSTTTPVRSFDVVVANLGPGVARSVTSTVSSPDLSITVHTASVARIGAGEEATLSFVLSAPVSCAEQKSWPFRLELAAERDFSALLSFEAVVPCVAPEPPPPVENPDAGVADGPVIAAAAPEEESGCAAIRGGAFGVPEALLLACGVLIFRRWGSRSSLRSFFRRRPSRSTSIRSIRGSTAR